MNNPYPICENCIFADEPLDKDPCQECNRAFLAQRIKPNFVSKHKPKANYDRIVSMKPEELAKELVVLSDRCPDGVDCESVPHGRECFECWLDWLQKEVAE